MRQKRLEWIEVPVKNTGYGEHDRVRLYRKDDEVIIERATNASREQFPVYRFSIDDLRVVLVALKKLPNAEEAVR